MIVRMLGDVNVLTDSSFGLTIAYLLPGFTALCGVGLVSPTVRAWLGTPTADAPTLGGFLYVTIASLTAGLLLSTIRWLVLDSLHHATGLKPPRCDFSRLQEHISAFNTLVADLYRFYQFYGAMMFASLFTYVTWRMNAQTAYPWHYDGCFLLLELLLFAGSRDTIKKYYDRSHQLLATKR